MLRVSPIRVAVLVSGSGTNLQALIDACGDGVIKSGGLALVVASRPGVYALERARAAGIESRVISREALGSTEAFEAALIEAFMERKIDLIVLAGFMSILSERFTRAYPDRIINIHPSLIPSFCGAGYYGLRVHRAALERGVKVTGATVHYVNEIPDGGRIILQKAVAVEEGDTPEILQERVMRQAEWIILPRALELVCRQILKGTNHLQG